MNHGLPARRSITTRQSDYVAIVYILIMTKLKSQPHVEDHVVAEAKCATSVEALSLRIAEFERFAAIVTHDLREPVAGILGLAGLLENAQTDEATRQEYVAILVLLAKKLDNTVTALHAELYDATARYEQQDLVNFADIVSDASIALGIRPRNLSLSTDFSDAERMLASKSYLLSIFQNLISNAMKYRRDDVQPALRITSKRTPTSIILSFKDNSLGIDLHAHGPDLFGKGKRFHTNDTSKASQRVGSGMGLYLVKRQVEALGGTIRVSSVVNAGTEFNLEFAR